jgi:hypothetical protein
MQYLLHDLIKMLKYSHLTMHEIIFIGKIGIRFSDGTDRQTAQYTTTHVRFCYVARFASNKNCAPCEGPRVIKKGAYFYKIKWGEGGSKN